MKTLVLALLLWMQVSTPASSATSYPGQCHLVSGPKADVTEIQCKGVPDGAVQYLNDFLRTMEQSRGESRLSRGMWIKLGQDWSRKFIDLKKLLHSEVGRDPIVTRIESFLIRGEFSKAGDLIDSALGPNQGASSLQAFLNYIRAKIYDLQFQNAASLPFYQKAYQHEKSNARYGLFYGLKLLDRNQFSQARTVFEGALKQLRKTSSKNTTEQQYHMGSLLINLGLIYKKTQNVQEARQSYREALELFQAISTRDGFDNRFEIAVTLDNLGNLFQETRKFNEAREVHTRALKIFRVLAEEQPEAYTEDLGIGLSNLGNLLGTLKKYEEARLLIEESLEIFRELAQTEASAYQLKLAILLDNTGVLYKRMGNLGKAEKAHKEALEVYDKMRETQARSHLSDYAITLANLAAVYELQKKYDEMEPVLEEAAEIFRELSKQNTMAYMPSLAMIYLTQGDFYAEIKNDPGRARELYQNALSRFNFLAKFNPDNYSRYIQLVQRKLKGLDSNAPPTR